MTAVEKEGAHHEYSTRILKCGSPLPPLSNDNSTIKRRSNEDEGKCSNNKSDESSNKPHIFENSSPVAPPQIRAPALSSSSSSSDYIAHQQVETIPTFLGTLIKVQTWLLILTNTVGNVCGGLRVIIPGNLATGSSSFFKMPATIAKPFGRKCLSQADTSSLDNNNVIKGKVVPEPFITRKAETVLSISNPIHTTASLDTITTIETVTTVDACNRSVDNVSRRQDGHRNDDIKIKKKQNESVSVTQSISRFITKYAGIFLALLASICMSLVTLVVKYMEQYHPVSKVIWRLQGVLVPSLLIVLYVKYCQKKPLIVWTNSVKPGNHWKIKVVLLLLIRGVVGCSADIFQYYSLRYLPLADSTVISFSTPIFVCFLAHFVLGERCGVMPVLSALVTFVGVVVISKPPILTGEEQMSNSILFGNVLAICCMICSTLTIVIMRYLKHVHFALTMLALGIVGSLEGFIVTLFTVSFQLPHGIDYQDYLLACLMAALFFFGQLSQTLALQREEAGVVSLVRTCDVLFAFIWQVNLLHQTTTAYSYVGAIIVTVGVSITAARRWVADMSRENPLRRKLIFMLK